MKYLDSVGLEYLWGKIKAAFATKTELSATVSAVSYDTTNKKIQKTIGGTTTDVVSASSIVTDGGGITSHQDISGKANTADLATVATTGDYTDLLNAPQYVICTLSTYNAMASHDSDTYYIIIAENNA